MTAPACPSHAAATAGLYERHSAKILGYCLHQLGSREEAEDAVQTTFMNAFRALGRGVVPESESAWLFKIAENVCLSRRRSSWRRGRIESPSDFDVIEEIVPGPTRQRDELIGIEDALASMPEQQRRAILLREWQGLSYREIADELEVSQSAVETLIFRARRSLAQGLEQPELQRKPKRKGLRRAFHIADAGTLLAAAKTLLGGSAAVKATAAAVAVTAVAGTAAGVKSEGHSPRAVESGPAVLAPAKVHPTAAVERAPGRSTTAPASARAARSTGPRARSAASTGAAEAPRQQAATTRAARPDDVPPAPSFAAPSVSEPPPIAAPATPDPSAPPSAPTEPAAQKPPEPQSSARSEQKQDRQPPMQLERPLPPPQREATRAAVVAVTPPSTPAAPGQAAEDSSEPRRGRSTERVSPPVVDPSAAVEEEAPSPEAAAEEQQAAQADPAEEDGRGTARGGRRG